MAKSINEVFKDGAVTITALRGHPTALLTVRGKDHDFTPKELEEFAAALLKAKKLLKQE